MHVIFNGLHRFLGTLSLSSEFYVKTGETFLNFDDFGAKASGLNFVTGLLAG
jgi:hypothetical protein